MPLAELQIVFPIVFPIADHKEHRNLFKPGDSVYMMWTKLRMQEANFNRLIAHQELTHQILYLRHSIRYAKEELESRKRKCEDDEDERLFKITKMEVDDAEKFQLIIKTEESCKEL